MKRIRGFTMIELLIVIAVLGILAVAVLAAINPIEQINRGRDTGSRSDAEQLLSAIDRYNASQMLWPWQDSNDPDADPEALDWKKVIIDDPAGSVCSMLWNLGKDIPTAPAGCTGTDEVKASFIERITNIAYNPLWIYYEAGGGASVYVCFNPQSGSFSQEATTRCTGTLPDDYPDANACGACDASAVADNPDCICLP